MLSNRLAFAALAVACIGAAAGGGYLATRQNVVPAPASAEMVAPVAAPAPALTAEQPATPAAVQETEAVVGDRPQSAAAPTPAAPPAPKAPASRNVEPERTAPRVSDRRPTPSRAPSGTVARQDQPPPLTSSWPSSAASQPPAPAQPPLPAEAPIAHPEERTVQEPPRPVEPPQKTFEELVVSADSVIGLQTENRISSETARVEDRVEARVTRDVKVGDRVAIPAGARALGSVMQVERGGKFKERARLGIRFHTLVLADGTRVPISTETIYRDGDAPGNNTAAKVGGAAVGGAIIGAILGGAKGAMIGSTAGAGAGTAAVMAGDRSAATLPSGTPMTVRLLSPVTVTKEE
jgi:type IV secretory pathway VirB10-like protein